MLCNKEAHEESTPALEAPLQGLLGGTTCKVAGAPPGPFQLCWDRHVSATLKKLPGARLQWDAAPRTTTP